MGLSPQKFREIVLQLLYSSDVAQAEDEDMLPFLMRELKVTKRVMRDALAYCKQLEEKQEEVDRLIGATSHGYELDRIQKVERSILRLGAFEILFVKDLSPKIAIAEAIRLCRKYATHEGSTFINAILDHIYKEKRDEHCREVPTQCAAP